MSYFLVDRQEMNQRNSKGDQISYTDLLAAGNGMYGGMGSGQYFSVSQGHLLLILERHERLT